MQLLAERHIDVSARTVLNWVQTFGPRLAKVLGATGDGCDGGGTWTRGSASGANRDATCIAPLINMGKTSTFYYGTNGTAPVRQLSSGVRPKAISLPKRSRKVCARVSIATRPNSAFTHWA